MTTIIPHVKLAKTRAELPPYRPGHWLVAGTPAGEPYPCTCWYSPCSYPKCPDQQRTEGAALPAGCCGRGSGVAGERTEAPARHANTPRSVRQPSRPRETPPSRVAPSRVAEDLWGPPQEDAPPRWDALDEASPVVVETWRPVTPGANGDAPVRQHSEPAERRSRVEQCECVTPWDPPPPVLLIARAKTGPVVTAVALPGRRSEVRELAEKLLAERGYRPKKDWADGRHVLLPPEGKLKTRSGFVADLIGMDSSEGAYAVIDTPPEQGAGIHCPDCCRHFQNRGAHEVHRQKGDGIERPRWDERCVDPASVRVLARSASISRPTTPGQPTGMPMLRRAANGVWSMDPLALWGPDGPPFGPAEAANIHARGTQSLKRWQFGKGHNRR